MRKIVILLLAYIALMLEACTTQYISSTYQKTTEALSLADQHKLVRQANWRLSTQTSLLLVKPAYPYRSSSGKTEYHRARSALLSALEHALLEQYPSTQVELSALSLEQAIEASYRAGARILVYPQLMNYLDRADQSEGNAKALFSKDKTRAQILLVDVYSGKIVDTALLESKSKVFNSSTNYASDLFNQAARDYVLQISGVAL